MSGQISEHVPESFDSKGIEVVTEEDIINTSWDVDYLNFDVPNIGKLPSLTFESNYKISGWPEGEEWEFVGSNHVIIGKERNVFFISKNWFGIISGGSRYITQVGKRRK